MELPRFVEWIDRGGPIAVDLDNPEIAASLSASLKSREHIEVAELFPPPDELLAEGPEGRFVHELIVPFSSESPPLSPLRPDYPSRTERRFIPGSEWLFAKLYSSPAVADRVLREIVRPMITDAVRSWFFVRYADPRPHLRVRVRGDPARLLGEVLPRLRKLLEPALKTGRVDALVLDTYERELERYGGDDSIRIVEEIFGADSEAALTCVECLPGDARKTAALLAAEVLLEDLGLDPGARLAVCEQLRGPVRGSALEPSSDDDEVMSILRLRSETIVPLVAELGEKRADLAPDLLHMMANRWLSDATAPEEQRLFDVLARRYRSEIARQATR